MSTPKLQRKVLTMTIGKRIKKRRQELKLSQDALANACGITKQCISKYERDLVIDIPIRKIEAIANALKVSPAYLVGWSEK